MLRQQPLQPVDGLDPGPGEFLGLAFESPDEPMWAASEAAIASAKAAIPMVRAKWAEALAAARSADWKVALDRADTVKKTAIELMASLGMPVPGSWQSSTADTPPAKH